MRAYYEDAAVTLYHGDCLEIADALPDSIAHAVVTDPPYSSGTRREGAKGVRKSMKRETADDTWFGTDCLTTNGFLWLMRACAREWKRLTVPGSHILSFIDWRMQPALAGALESADLRHVNLLVWDKVGLGMGTCFRNQHELLVHFTNGMGREPFRRDCPNVLQASFVRNGLHETEKPLELVQRLVDVVTFPGETVLDFYAGSGTTLVAAKAIGRRAVGMEIEERYCEIAAKRLSQEVLGLSPVAAVMARSQLPLVGDA